MEITSDINPIVSDKHGGIKYFISPKSIFLEIKSRNTGWFITSIK